MPLFDHQGKLSEATRMLLRSVSRVASPLLKECRILPRSANWLYFPWYLEKRGGGAFVLGNCIYLSGNLIPAHGGNDKDNIDPRALLLLAHEVGHLPHAARFRITAWGRTRFILWALGHYFRSYLEHGRTGYRRSRIEQEAERGRWVLRSLIASSSPDELSVMLHALKMNDVDRMRTWLKDHEQGITELHASYPGW